MKAAGYIRVSTNDQATKGLSLQAQRDLLERYAREHGMTLVGIYADEGKSAAKSLEKREAPKPKKDPHSRSHEGR